MAVLAGQQPGGIANYQNVTVPNVPPGGTSVAGFFIEVDGADRLVAYVSRPFLSVDGWLIECTGPSSGGSEMVTTR